MRLLSSTRVSLALAGGNALGAYAAGAYESLHEAGIEPDLVSGASIGAVTATLIAGNRPEHRVDRLRAFWRQAAWGSALGPAPGGGRARDIYNKLHVLQTVMAGRPGLFAPRPTGFLSLLPGTPSDLGLFDPRPLITTLERLVDFDFLNAGHLPLVVSCVDLETGEPVYFDSRRQRIEPHHLLASTAFIPGFPPTEIDGRCLGDPGVFCNLPLDPVLHDDAEGDHLCFAVDLFESRGSRPRSLDMAMERAQDIAFSSQSMRTIEAFRREHRLRHLLGRIGRRAQDDDAAQAEAEGVAHDTALALLAYRAPEHETGAKAVEFSRASIDERWAAGHDDMAAAVDAVQHDRATARDAGFRFFDARRPG